MIFQTENLVAYCIIYATECQWLLNATPVSSHSHIFLVVWWQWQLCTYCKRLYHPKYCNQYHKRFVKVYTYW